MNTAQTTSGKFWPSDSNENFEPAIGDSWEASLVTKRGLDVSGRTLTVGMREELVNGMETEIVEMRKLAEPKVRRNPWTSRDMRKLVPNNILRFTHVAIVRRVS